MTRLVPPAVTWLAALALAAPAARAQPMTESFPPAKLPGESAAAARRLAEVQKRVEKEEWAEAVEEYQKLLDEAGDELAALDPQRPQHCVSVRRLCHLRLAALPPAALRLYRARVDDQAKQWLEQGTRQRDPGPLRRVVEQAFCSRAGDRALDLLGDLAFERGDFVAAEHWWRLLARPASEAGAKRPELALLFPDPQADVAVVRAKIVLARLFRGERAAAAAELKAFKALHGQAEGRLAGRDGPLADILQAAADAPDLAPPADDRAWPTFAGDGTRNRLFPRAPRVRWLDEPWRVPLEGKADGKGAPPCAVAPAVAGDCVVVADARSVSVYDLFTGKRLGRCDLRDDLKAGGFVPEVASLPGEVRYTVTVAGDRIYARLGARAVIDPRALAGPRADAAETSEAKADSFLVCLGLHPDGRGKLPVHWQAKARLLETDPATFFEGAPLVRDGRVYAARTRCTDPAAVTTIDCYDAETGAPRWRQAVCDAREQRESRPRYRHHLLTAAGPNVVYCSHSGAVVALDALSGKRAWAARYPRRGERADGGASPRDLAPCVYADGRLFVAPADADRVLCLDADGGGLLWESKPVEVLYLLGVAGGRLVFTTAAAPRGIRAVDAATGRDVRAWVQPDDGSSELPSVGRGLLAGGYVFWPTQHGLRVLNQEDGQPAAALFVPPDNPIKGNLAVGRGCLVVATAKELLGYVPESHLLEQRQKEAADQPGAALAQYRLAVALADADQPDKALDALERAARLVRPGEKVGDLPLREGVRKLRDRAYRDLAARAEARQRWDEAAGYLTKLAADGPLPGRLQARVRLGALWEKAGQPARAVEAWQAILADEALRRCVSATADGPVVPAGLHAAMQIDRLIAAEGAAVYAKWEAEAEALVKDTKESVAEAVAVRLAEEYPSAAVTGRVLRQIARQSGLTGRLARAWLSAAQKEDDRAVALAALARHYEARKDWETARETWLRLEREAGALTVAALDAERPVRDLVGAELRKREYRAAGLPSLPDLPVPLGRAWHVPLDGEELLAGGADSLLLRRGEDVLACRDAATGKARWSAAVGGPPRWAAARGDVVLAAGPRCVCGLRRADGGLLWKFGGTPDDAAADLAGFRLVDGRLFFLEDERRLWALDVETGQALWNHVAPGTLLRSLEAGGRFSPHFHAGRDRVVVQTTAGRGRFFDAVGGGDVGGWSGRGAWPRPPLALDGRRLVLVPDARHVALLDLATGKEVWRRPLGRDPSLTGEPPQVLGGGDTLLVLVPRNFGQELQRLDPATGAPLWAKPRLIEEDDIDLSRAAVGPEAVYLVAGGLLRAVHLANGRPLWDCPLRGGAGPWQVRLTRGGLLAYSDRARTELDAGHTARRSRAADVAGLYPTLAPLPLGAALATALAARQQALSAGQFPVLLIDPGDGQPVQRLNFATRGPGAGVCLLPRGAAVAAGDVLWGVR